jgi:hypothetical protein
VVTTRGIHGAAHSRWNSTYLPSPDAQSHAVLKGATSAAMAFTCGAAVLLARSCAAVTESHTALMHSTTASHIHSRATVMRS